MNQLAQPTNPIDPHDYINPERRYPDFLGWLIDTVSFTTGGEIAGAVALIEYRSGRYMTERELNDWAMREVESRRATPPRRPQLRVITGGVA